MTSSPEIAAAFNSAGIDPVAWTVAVRRMMLQLSKGNIRTAHRVLEDFVANHEVTNLEGPIDPEYCQWLEETDGQLVVCARCQNQPVDDAPVIVRLPTVQQKEPVNMDADLTKVLEAIDLLSNQKTKCLSVVDRKIEELEAELERYRSVRAMLGGAQPEEPKVRPSDYRRKNWSGDVERIREYLAKHGPAKPSVIAEKLGITSVGVGIAIKTVEGIFRKDGDGRVILVA